MDPATAREGWIYEEHVTVKEGPGDTYQEAAIASEVDSVILKKPKQSFKPKKSRKNYEKKRWRKRFVSRFRRFQTPSRARYLCVCTFSLRRSSALKTNAPAVKDFKAIEPRDQKSTHTVEHGGARNGYCCELIG